MNGLHVLFTVAGCEYVIPAADVLHMESYSGATPVPGAPAHVAGLIQVRGRVLPVVDVRARFGLPADVAAAGARVVVVQDGTRAVGLLVDGAREVINLPAERFQPPPEMVGGGGRAFVTAVAQAGDRLLMLIDHKRVIGEEPRDGQ
jgi:purine-binding chemotaxis protein CheW